MIISRPSERIYLLYARISSNDKFKQLITEKIGESIDTSELQKQKLDYEKGLRSVSRTIESLGYQLDNLDVEEKKRCLHEMIESIEIRKNLGAGKQGRIDYSKVITAIKFKFPINIKENELTDIYLTNESADETVVLMSRSGKSDAKGDKR